MQNQWLEFAQKDRVVLREADEALEPRPGQVLLRAEVSVISPGTELARLHEHFLPRPNLQNRPPAYPVRPGYAMVGQVVASAEPTVKPGERLLARCRHARFNVVNLQAPNYWCRVPESMASDHAALAPLAQIAMSAPLSIDVRWGHRVLVIGLGLIGYLAQQWMLCSPALAVDGCDLRPPRLAFAGARGGRAMTPDEAVAAARLEPYDIVVEATGSVAGTQQAFDSVREGGAVLLLGTAREKLREFDIANAIHRRFVTVVGTHQNRHDRAAVVGPATATGNTLETSLRFIHAGRLRVEGLIGAVYEPAQAAEAYAAIEQQGFYTVGLRW